jgi:hypothetical protein
MKKIVCAAVLAFAATGAQAATYDLIDAIDGAGGPINESIWSEFNTSDFSYFDGPSVSLSGAAGTAAAYAYADAGTAGFGVCRTPSSNNFVNVANPGWGNVCNPGSDDSIQSEFDEVLMITANENSVLIKSITVNANHDGRLKAGDKVKIGGVEITLGAGDIVNGYYTHVVGTVFNINDILTVESVDRPHLYLSAIELSSIPLPAPAFLLIGGLGALGAASRRRKSR